MTTINISLPSALKSQAETLVTEGYYASFSDLVRDSLRRVIGTFELEILAKEAKLAERLGKSKTLKNKKDVASFVGKNL